MGSIHINDKELINTDSITSIEIRPKRVYPNYHWKTEYKLFGFILWRKEGFHDRMGQYIDLIIKDYDNYYIENFWVYYNPHIVINLNDQSERRIYFKTVELMQEYIKQFENKHINFIYI